MIHKDMRIRHIESHFYDYIPMTLSRERVSYIVHIVLKC